MRQSEDIQHVAAALVAAQSEIKFAHKNTKNEFLKNQYADLPSVIDAVKAPLNNHGLCFLQAPSPSEPGMLALTTRILHVSGQWLEDTAHVPLPKNEPRRINTIKGTLLKGFNPTIGFNLHTPGHHAHVKLARKRDIRGEAALSGEERPVLEPSDRAADKLAARGAHLPPRTSAAAARTALMMF